ncbi:hypothetical protein DOT_4976 [Desulfosporosinus sp. OT]|nr:hypothetical protein DOT_4976 [Desulfosporosinus sp. OT]
MDQYSFLNTNRYERQANEFAVQLLLSTTNIHTGETIEHFFLRNGVPTEMIKYFYKNF